MRKLLFSVFWGSFVTAVVYALVSADGGLIHQTPWMPLAIGLIGFGLCKDAKDRARTAATASDK